MSQNVLCRQIGLQQQIKKRNSSSSQFFLRTPWMWVLSTPKLPLISVSKIISFDLDVLSEQVQKDKAIHIPFRNYTLRYTLFPFFSVISSMAYLMNT